MASTTVLKRDSSMLGFEPAPGDATKPLPKIKLLTWNIWAGASTTFMQERVEHILTSIKREEPDVASLLDVSVPALELIVSALTKTYLVFQVFKESTDATGTVLLCRRSTVSIRKDTQPYYYEYKKGSNVIGAELVHTASGARFDVLSTRLNDDPESDHVRESQCDVLYHVTRNMNNYVLMGDFNSYDYDEAVEQRMQSLTDAYVALQCPRSVQFTYDGMHNTLVGSSTRRFRNSRVYYKSSDGGLAVKSLSLIGTRQIPNIDAEPSMYYGLIAEFILANIPE